MAEFCPDLLFQNDPTTEGGFWAGPLKPLRDSERIWELLDDIHHNRPVYTAWRGTIRHIPECSATHHRHDWMEHLRPDELMRSFSIHLYYGGGSEDPRCWVDGIDRTNGRHMWDDGSICPFLSSKSSWNWTHDTAADFLGHASVFLITWMAFQQTGVWIVGEHDNNPGYHLGNIRPNDHCWCRSGKKYRKCHMQSDRIAFMRGPG